MSLDINMISSSPSIATEGFAVKNSVKTSWKMTALRVAIVATAAILVVNLLSDISRPGPSFEAIKDTCPSIVHYVQEKDCSNSPVPRLFNLCNDGKKCMSFTFSRMASTPPVNCNWLMHEVDWTISTITNASAAIPASIIEATKAASKYCRW